MPHKRLTLAPASWIALKAPSGKLLFVLFFLFTLAPVLVRAQTSSSALVTGTVYDPSQAVVPGATVELRDKATNVAMTQTTNALGAYTFPTVLPGTYKVTVTAQGFRTTVIPELRVAVAQSFTVNVTLEVGTTTQTVEVQATAAVELQKTDATVGDVIAGDELKYLPTPGRSVSSLLMLQPLVMPGRGVDNTAGGQVAGARSDQTTFLLDGGDVTSDLEGTGGYNTSFSGEPEPVIPIPAESVEEFRVGTTNPNATFGRSQGGQVAIVTKRGTNNIHGSVYWYHQNDNLNANSWDRNASGIKRPELKDNRYGFTLGGPVLKDRVWLFGHYEGRKFPQTSTVNRVVPLPDLRNGIMTFKDLAGNLVKYDLRTVALCGTISVPDPLSATGSYTLPANRPCDPRGLGISPVVQADMAALPSANFATGIGDSLNTSGYRFVIPRSLSDQFAVTRLDYKINDKWNFFGTYRYFRELFPGNQQVDITGLSGCKAPCSVRNNPLQPRYTAAGVNAQLKPNLLSETRFSWYRHWWAWNTTPPKPQVAGTAAALSLAGEGTASSGSVKIADPYNIDTQQGRFRIWNGRDTFVAENLTWLKGSHSWQFGGSYRFENIVHVRSDRVTGGLSTAPIFYLNAGSFFLVPSGNRPPTCRAPGTVSPNDPGIATNCLIGSSNRTRWNNWYAALLGIPDRSAQMLTRDGDLNPQPLGSLLKAHVHIHAVEGYFQDIWKMTPSFTLTYGLTYQVQRPPTEENGKQMVPVYAASNTPVNVSAYFKEREIAALKGNILNPDFAFMPVNHLTSQKYAVPLEWHDFGPRIAFSWNPSMDNFFFRGRKTVLRGGWSVTYTRMNGVGLVMTPILGIGPGQILACKGPQSPTAGNGSCSGDSRPANAFRVGPTSGGWDGDGSNLLPGKPLAPIPSITIPIQVSSPYGETRSFGINPSMTHGYSHSFDLTLQRELPWNMLMEVGYVGRLGRNLTQTWDLNSVPFMLIDPTSKQSLAAAFDAVEQASINGTAIAPQQFFENYALAAACAADLIANTNPGCPTGRPPSTNPNTPNYSSVTSYILNQFSFETSTGDLATVMTSSSGGLDVLRFKNGQAPSTNIQASIQSFTTGGGISDYHAGFASLRKRFSQGLTFDANYTLGHSLDIYGINQEYTQYSPASPFRPNFDRGPSVFDARHVFNFHWFYELPFGRGKRYSTGSTVLDKVIGGWQWAGIWSMRSGLPQCVYGGFDYGAPEPQNPCALPIKSMDYRVTRHFGVNGDPASGVAINGDPANGGSGLNMFANPLNVFNNFRYPLITKDGRFGFGAFHGLRRWNVDMSIGKKTSIRERYALIFTFDFLNAFNHVEFNDPSLDLTDPSSFGVLSSQFASPRFIQFGLRIEF